MSWGEILRAFVAIVLLFIIPGVLVSVCVLAVQRIAREQQHWHRWHKGQR